MAAMLDYANGQRNLRAEGDLEALGERPRCALDFEMAGGEVVEAGAALDDGRCMDICLREAARLDLREFRYINRDRREFWNKCLERGLSREDLYAAVRDVVRGRVVVCYDALMELECLRRCFRGMPRFSVFVCDAAEHLPGVHKTSERGRPIFERVSLKKHAAALGVSGGPAHVAVADAMTLELLVRAVPHQRWAVREYVLGGEEPQAPLA